MTMITENLPQEKNLESEKLTIAEKMAKLLRDSERKNIDDLLQRLPPKEQMSLEDVFIAVYCVVSEFLTNMGGPQRLRRSNNHNPEFTDAEVICLELVGQLAKQASQSAWYRYARKNYCYLFPRLCSRSRYVRRVFQLDRMITYFQQNLCTLLASSYAVELIIDSFPIALCNMQRLKSSSQPFELAGANFGYCAAKKLHYYGLKCHIVTDLRGIPVFVCLTSASMSDLHAFEFVVAQMLELHLLKGPTIYIGDKGYVGQAFQQQIKERYGVTLLSMEREYQQATYGPSPRNECLKPIRKLVETSIDLFSVELHAGTTKRRTLKGLLSSLITKLAAFNLANFLNYLLGRPLLELSSFVF